MTLEQQSHGEVLLSAINLSRAVNNKQHVLWRGISFDVCRGDIMFVRGPSGVGKTLLLRTLACLDPVEGGIMRLHGQSPSETGIPAWRAQVMYVHQQRVSYPGTPLQLFERVQGFASQKPRGVQGPEAVAYLVQLVEQMGLDQAVLSQQWSQLSGGQAQRISLALSIALKPDVILLDEPTSACDSDATLRVEAVLRQVASSAAVLWVTHDDQQPTRVGGKVLVLPSGDMSYLEGEQQQQQEQQQSDSSSQSSNNSSSSTQQPIEHTVLIPDALDAPVPQAAWRAEAAAVKA